MSSRPNRRTTRRRARKRLTRSISEEAEEAVEDKLTVEDANRPGRTKTTSSCVFHTRIWQESILVQAGMQLRRPPLGATRRGKLSRRPVDQAGISTLSSSPSSPTPSTSPQFLPYRPLSVASLKGKERGHMFTIWDKNNRAYLADTGADVSVFPASPEDRRKVAQTPLAAANGTGIKTWGRRNIRIQLGSRTFWQST